MVADVVPQRFDSEGLFETLRDRQEDWTGVRVLLLRAEVGHPLLPDSLQSIGAVLTTVPVYRTACPKTSAPSALEHVESVDTVTFTSPSSVQNLLQLLGEGGVELLRERTRIAIGRVTLGALEQIGLAGTLLATEATVEGIVATLVQDAAERPL
jgi:uroporphyrinogen III methyltransferase/synthase